MNSTLKTKAEQVLCSQHQLPIISFNIDTNASRGERLICERCNTVNKSTIFTERADGVLSEWWKQELDLIAQCRQKFNGINSTILQLQGQLVKQLENYVQIQKLKLASFFTFQTSKIKFYEEYLTEIIKSRENSELKKTIDLTKQQSLGTTILQDIAIFLSKHHINGEEVKQQDIVSFTDFQILIQRPLIEKVGWPLWQMNLSLKNKLGVQNQEIEKYNQELERMIKDYLFETKQQFSYHQQPSSLITLQNKITSIAISIDDKMIAIGGETGQIKLYKRLDQAPITLSARANIQDIIFSNDDKYLAVSQFSEPFQILLFQINQNLQTNSVPAIILQGHNDIIWRIQFAQNSQFLLSGSRDQTFKIWKKDTQSDILEKKLNNSINCVNISPNEKYISVCCGNGKVYIFDHKQFTKLLQKVEFQAHEQNAYCSVFTQDSTMLLTSQKEIKLWSLDLLLKGKVKLPLKIFNGVSAIWSIKSEFNGTIIIALDDKIKIWNAETGKLKCEINLPQDQFNSINTKNFVVFQNLQSILVGGRQAITQFRIYTPN